MKARVKETGEIIDVFRYTGVLDEANSRIYNWYEIETIDTHFANSYWTKLEHQYAGMAMQGILSNQDYCRLLIDENNKGSFAEDISRCASAFAHALVEKYKKEE